jgi:fluoride ion exporter CrcB/FEX
MIESALFGLTGGIVRGIVGLTKMREFKQKFNLYKLLFTLVTSAAIGMFAGLLTVGDYRISLLAGYAGTDFIEGLYSIRKKQGTV